ncbi:MAG TPA: glycosyltransferase family 4 protein [Vicinamibacterales bacterium]
MKLAVLLHGGVDRTGEDRVIHAFFWLLERLARRHDVHVFAFNQEPEPATWELAGTHVHNIGPGKGWRRRLAAAFAAEHRASPFELIHGIFGWGGMYGALLGWRHRVPVLFHPAGGELVALNDIAYGMRCTARGRLELRIATAGARRVTVATAYMEDLAASLRIAARRVPLGVAIDKWPPCDPRPRHDSQRVRLVHVGDIRPVKDQAMLLSAADTLRRAGLDFHLDIVGFDTTDGALRRSPRARSLEPHVRWHGVLGRADLHAVMERADILLMTSRHEAGPLVVLEAAIAGVPTVGTNVGHVADWAPHAAVAVAVGDAEALARETVALVADEPRRLCIAREAQRRAIAIDADFTAATFERIYEEMRTP